MRLKRNDHKGENGRVLVIGGSEDYTGAVTLASIAALRCGVDIVSVAAPEKVAWAINGYIPDIITKKLVGKELDITHAKELIELSEKFDCILIGNGLGLKKELVLKVARSIDKPKVIDADAIKVLNISLVKNCIFTPHKKEFEMLYNSSLMKKPYSEDLNENIKEMQKVMNDNVILLKGQVDFIFNSKTILQNKTGHNSMTIGGTGGILAGICAGIMARGGSLFERAQFAAYANGKAGEYMFKQKGYSYLASEMANELWRFVRT
jgi:ADP-dependent NAD(P)H-hydrate dehydratase / NAD(P)H-hydrate epimerase